MRILLYIARKDKQLPRAAYSQTKWSVPLKIALMNWLFEYLNPASRFKNAIMNWLFEYRTR